MARIGLVQTAQIGDIVIALPIAAAFARAGNEVLWPVDADFIEFLRPAAPYVSFLPVPPNRGAPYQVDYLVQQPMAALQERGCDAIHLLYSRLAGADLPLQAPKLAEHLKFDEYKYAVTGVAFAEKWNLELRRDAAREQRLFASLGITREYICVHRRGSRFEAKLDLPPEWRRDFQIVEIDERSGSPFDWLLALERAAKLMCVDSLFANLVEQLNLPNEKYLMLRSPGLSTPVFRNGWRFLA